MIQRLKVLIMEDNEDDCLLVLRELKKLVRDLSYENIDSGEELRDILNGDFDFDIILSDYSMRSFTAMDALNILNEHNKRSIPFILVSGEVGEETAVLAMRKGARDFINKSKYDRLIPVIERELVEAKKSKEIREAHETLVQNELQFRALYKLSRMIDYPLSDVESFTIAEMIKLTKSKVGCIAYSMDKDSTVFEVKKNLLVVSNDENNKLDGLENDLTLETKDNMILDGVVKNRDSVIINDLAKENIFTFGDQLKLNRVLAIPFAKENSEVEIVVIMGNKEMDYTLRDLEKVQLLVDSMIRIRQKKLYDEKIMESLREKDILLREIHHRVKNNLQIISSLLNLQSRAIKDEVYSGIFKESRDRIKTMSLVHEKLYQSDNLGFINFNGYIRSVATNLFHSYNNKDGAVSLEINVDELHISIDLAIPCGLIINEIISNSLKYAFPDGRKGTIKVSAEKSDNGKYKIEVSDNGLGFSISDAKEKSSSLGLKLINALVNQIEGEMEVDANNGTTFTIIFGG